MLHLELLRGYCLQCQTRTAPRFVEEASHEALAQLRRYAISSSPMSAGAPQLRLMHHLLGIADAALEQCVVVRTLSDVVERWLFAWFEDEEVALSLSLHTHTHTHAHTHPDVGHLRFGCHQVHQWVKDFASFLLLEPAATVLFATQRELQAMQTTVLKHFGCLLAAASHLDGFQASP